MCLFMLVPLLARSSDAGALSPISHYFRVCLLRMDRRKRKRYNTFRASHNPIPPKRSLRRHLKAISSQVSYDDRSSSSCMPVSSNVDLQHVPTGCHDQHSNQNDHLHLPTDDVILSGNESDSSMEDENHLQTSEADQIEDIFLSLPKEHGTDSEFERPEEIVCSTSSTDSQTNEVHPDDIILSVNESESTVEDEDPHVYPSCPLRLSESVLLIMTLSIRHKLTGDALADVIKLIDLHCIPGPNSRSIKTLRELKSYFENSKEALDLFYYCKCCYCLLPTENTMVCPICNTDLSSPSAKGYFIVLPIEHQLSKFLSRKYYI